MNTVRLGWTLIHFLWQGALIAALYAVARGSRSASFRYSMACLALAAMVAAPVATYNRIGARNSYEATAPAATQLTTPETRPALFTGLPAHAVDARKSTMSLNAMFWLVAAWLTGVLLFCTRLTGAWIVAARMKSQSTRPAPACWQQALDELKHRIRISAPVKLLISARVQVPTVVGWLRPVILVPIGVLTGLPAEHIEALLAHELAHIRRHDYLVNILQGVAESLLFYHPAVWWISNQIRHERELCCDDIAISLSGDTLTYVRALAELESRRPAPYSPALAANGGSLSDRIARLLGVHRPDTRRVSGPAIVTVAALIAIAAAAAFAQSATPAPSFEVASIKPSPPDYVGFQSYVKGDRYTAMTATVSDLISFAYRLRSFQISGGPSWSSETAYNISAMMGPAAQPAQARAMMQSLLSDRFGLKFHRITKNFPGYILVVDKNGPKLTESANPGPGLGLGRGHLNGRGADMLTLAMELSSQLESPITDKTGLKALYDFTLIWTPDDQAADSPGPSLFTAIRDQLGLRLEPVKKVPVDILVIDHVNRPTPD